MAKDAKTSSERIDGGFRPPHVRNINVDTHIGQAPQRPYALLEDQMATITRGLRRTRRSWRRSRARRGQQGLPDGAPNPNAVEEDGSGGYSAWSSRRSPARTPTRGRRDPRALRFEKRASRRRWRRARGQRGRHADRLLERLHLAPRRLQARARLPGDGSRPQAGERTRSRWSSTAGLTVRHRQPAPARDGGLDRVDRAPFPIETARRPLGRKDRSKRWQPSVHPAAGRAPAVDGLDRQPAARRSPPRPTAPAPTTATAERSGCG
jgi:hypothetical protein